MVKIQTTLRAVLKSMTIVFAVAILLAACAPQQVAPTQDIQARVATSVAMTVAAQNAQTAAVQPLATATFTPTDTPATVPTLTPILATATTFVIVPPFPSGGGGGGGAPVPAQYACSWIELKPRTNVFSRGDAIDVKWLITNTGTKKWEAGKDLDYVSGTIMSTFLGQELPALSPGDSVTISFDANAPMTKGLFGMQFKVEGGLCWPALNIQVK